MPKLFNRSKNTELAHHLEVADTIVKGAIGLLGHSEFKRGFGMWIHNCRSIHTWFMQFPIDVIFVDKDLKVISLHQNLGAWKWTWPAWAAKSVFELPAGTLTAQTISLGDELYVGD